MSGDDIPLAADLEKAGMDAHAVGKETFLVELPWRAGIVLADTVRAYFAPETSQRCFVCDQARTTQIDMAIDALSEEMMRVAYMTNALEELLEQHGKTVPGKQEIVQEVVRSQMQVARTIRRRPQVTISDELRAIVREWPKPDAVHGGGG